jgi:DNA replication protein DnaC
MKDYKIPPEIMLKCGILEAYWDSSFNDFYGHPDKRAELEPKINAWNAAHSDLKINLDFDKGNQILQTVFEYVKNLENARKYGISLVLWGTNGTGKTLLATCVLKEAIRNGFSSQMTSLGGIIERYADGWNDHASKEQFTNRIKDVDFLLIDDVGKEYRAKNNDLVEIAFDNLIRYRTFRHKPFILTTNTDISKLQNTYGKSIASLIMGKCVSTEISGIDYRIVIQAKDVMKLLRGDENSG